jgi:hypothetical protein
LERSKILAAVVLTIGLIVAAFYFSFAGINSDPSSSSSFIWGASGFSGSNFPSSFISTVTGTYHITAFRIPYDLLGQFPMYVKSGTTFIYSNYNSGTVAGLVSFLQSNPQVNMVGLTNEPNGCSSGQACQTPQQYATMLVADYNALKQAGINTPLCAFEVAGSANSNDQNYVQQVINDGGAGHYDYACIHIYPPQGDQSQISSNLDAMEKIVGVPIYITEANIANCPYVPNVPNPAQAMQSLISIFESKPYIKGVFWYDLSDSNACGLFSPGPSYSITSPEGTTYVSLISSYSTQTTTSTESTTTGSQNSTVSTINSSSVTSVTYQNTNSSSFSPIPTILSIAHSTVTFAQKNLFAVQALVIGGLVAGVVIIRRRL